MYVLCLLLIIGSVIYGGKIVNDTLYINNLIVRSFGMGLYPLAFPLQATRFIKENNLAGNIFNSYSYGAYLNWALYPSYKTFIHGAVLDPTILESKQLYKYYLGISLGKIDMSDLTKRFGVTILLLDHKAETAIETIDKLLLDANWKLVYADFSSLLFIANSEKNRHIIEAHPVNLYDADSLIPDYLEQQNNSIYFASAYNQIGALYGSLGRHEEALYAFVKGDSYYPGHFVTKSNMASVYAQLNQYEKAKDFYEASLKLNPNFPKTKEIYTKFLVHAAKEYLKSEKRKEAYDLLFRALEIDPNFSEAKSLLKSSYTP